MIVRIDGSSIVCWNSFHDQFAEVFGFPASYGRNLDAWIDGISSIDAPEDGMSKVQVTPGSVLTLVVDNARAFKARSRAQYLALLECAAFVNWRRVQRGEAGVLVLAFDA